MEGQPDYKKLIEEAKSRPSPLTIQEQRAELMAASAKVIAHAQEIGPEGVAREANERESAFRRQQELEGRLRTAAESKRLADALAEKAAEAASVVPETMLRQAEARAKYDEAMRLSAERLAAPIPEAELQAAYERQQSIRQRFDAAKAESLRPKDLPSEKF